MTNYILKLINDKNDLLDIAKRTQSEDDWQAACVARNLVASIVKDAKKDFLTKKLKMTKIPISFGKGSI